MTGSSSPSDAAATLGVSREVLLTWERRFGFPTPHRLANGSRAYSPALVEALLTVKARRDAGVPLVDALTEARQHYEGVATHHGETAIPPSAYRAVLDDADALISILAGPDHRVEYANAKHRAAHPDRTLIGRPALSVLEATQVYDLARVLRHVMTTGNTLSWYETLVPFHGQDRWWDFSYRRLPIEPDQPVRLLMWARDVTKEVMDRQATQASIERSQRALAMHQRSSELFELLTNACEQIAQGRNEFDPEFLWLLLRGLRARGISTWRCEEAAWRRVLSSGGDGTNLPRYGMEDSIRTSHTAISDAFRSGAIPTLTSTDLWPGLGSEEDSSIEFLLVPIAETTSSSGSFLLIEEPDASNPDQVQRLLQAVAKLLRRTR